MASRCRNGAGFDSNRETASDARLRFRDSFFALAALARIISHRLPSSDGPEGRASENAMTEHVDIGGVRLFLSTPDDSSGEWIGQREVLKQLLACWLVVDERDLPLAPRLVGAPGIGKTTLAVAAARARQQAVYIYQCTADTRPEDLLVTPVLSEEGRIKYHASP